MRGREPSTHLSLVVFTVLTQAAAGLCVGRVLVRSDHWLGPASEAAFPGALGLLLAAAAAAWLHLARPGATRFVLANVRTSWLSREVLLSLLFGALLVGELATRPVVLDLPGARLAAEIAAAATGLALVIAIARLYMLRTVPVWNTWTTPTMFLGTALLLGSSALVATVTLAGRRPGVLVVVPVLLAVLQLFLTLDHVRSSRRKGGTAAESMAVLDRDHRMMMIRRLGATVLGAILTPISTWAYRPHPGPAVIAFLLLLVGEGIGRYLFYASYRRVGL